MWHTATRWDKYITSHLKSMVSWKCWVYPQGGQTMMDNFDRNISRLTFLLLYKSYFAKHFLEHNFSCTFFLLPKMTQLPHPRENEKQGQMQDWVSYLCYLNIKSPRPLDISWLLMNIQRSWTVFHVSWWWSRGYKQESINRQTHKWTDGIISLDLQVDKY